MSPVLKPSIVALRAAAEASGVPVRRIIGRQKTGDVIRPRFAVYLVARHLGESTPSIGNVLDGRDHTTVLSGQKSALKMLGRDGAFRALVDAVREKTEARVGPWMPPEPLLRAGAPPTPEPEMEVPAEPEPMPVVERELNETPRPCRQGKVIRGKIFAPAGNRHDSARLAEISRLGVGQ